MANKTREWKEAELILHFQLQKVLDYTPLMQEWLTVEPPIFTPFELQYFEERYEEGRENVTFWGEEDLKIYFISSVLRLSGLMNRSNKGFVGVFEKKISGEVNNTKLSVRSDFMVAKGFKNIIQTPYFHFQEYKPQLQPSSEPMAQLLEAFLIAQAQNKKDNPLYGCEVIGGSWRFVLMEDKEYCVSEAFDCTKRESLLKIIAILRKFKEILETRLLD